MKKKKILTIGGITLGVTAIVAPLIATFSGALKTSYQIAPYSNTGDTIGLKNYVYYKESNASTNSTTADKPDTSQNWKVDLYDHLVNTKTITEQPKIIDGTKNGTVESINSASIGTEIGIWASKGEKESFAFTQWIDNQAPYIPFSQPGLDNKVYNVVKKGVLPVHGLNSPENYRDWISQNQNETIKWTGGANPFKNTKVPLSVGFVDSPTSTYFQSILTALITWRTIYEKDKNGEYVAKADMYLEGAKDITIKYASSNGQSSAPTDHKVKVTNGIIDLEDAKTAMLNNGGADTVEFTINNELKWYDTNGKIQSKGLTAKDFMAGLIAYYNSCELSFNANSYFFDLAGVDFKGTLEANNIKEQPKPNTNGVNEYNLDQMNENKFVLKIGNTKNSSLLDILTKEYFFALPYHHPKTKEYIKPLSEYTIEKNNLNKVKVIRNKNGGHSIDPQATNWDFLYGGGNQQTNPDVWSSSAYRISKSTLPETTITRNDGYFDALNKAITPSDGKNIIWDKDKTVKTFILVTGGDNEPTSPEVTYDAFRSGTYDYAVVPSTRQLSALGTYKEDSSDNKMDKVLITQPPAKAPQAQTINYNTNIWGPDGKRKSNITEVYENFVKKFNTDGKVIRQGINSMVNWAKLANLSFSNVGAYDYIQSIVPYGQLDKQYQEMRQTKTSAPNEKGGMPLTGATLQTFENMKNSSDYDINNNVTKAIKDHFEKALDNIGATKQNPLVLDFRTLHSVYSSGQTAYLQKLTSIIDGISNGRIRFNLISRTNKSLTDWYYNKNSPMGSFFWSPDYNDVGTWVGLYFEMKPKKTGAEGPKENNEVYTGFQGAYGVATLWTQLYNEIVAAKKQSIQTQPKP